MYKPSRYNVIFEDGDYLVFVNLLTRAIARLKKDEGEVAKRILKNPNVCLDPESEKIRQDMIYGGFLIESDFDEIEHLKMANRLARFSGSSASFIVIPTFACNFACVYCYETGAGPSMDEETVELVASYIEKIAAKKRHVHVGWFGGEPLLAFHVAERINERVKNACQFAKTEFSSSMSTNGYLLDKEKASLLDELGIKSVQITIDGPKECHDLYRPLKGSGGTYDVIMRNLSDLFEVSHDVQVTIRVNVGPDNFDRIGELLDDLERFPKDRFRIYFRWIFGGKKKDEFYSRVFVFRSEKSLDILDFYAEAAERGFKVFLPLLNRYVFCEFDSVSSVVIGPRGEIYPCTVNLGEGAEIGRITREGVKIDKRKYLKWHSFDPFEDKRCLDCKLLPVCMGGCRNARYMGKRGCPEESKDVVAFARKWYRIKEIERKVRKFEDIKVQPSDR